MALLRELGNKYPVSTEGVEFDVEDQEIAMAPGDIVEAWFESDKDITYYNVAPAVEEIVVKLKEEYPGFVLHYLKFETRRVTIQYSIAPGQPISSGTKAIAAGPAIPIWLAIVIIIAAVTAAILVTLRAFRGYWWTKPPPRGNALAIAKDYVSEELMADIQITCNGMEGTTGPNGEGVLFEDVLAGPHVFVGAAVAGYQTPTAVEENIIADKQIVLEIWYVPDGVIPPTHGTLIVDTTPVKGSVFIEGEDHGEAPIVALLKKGTYNISYGVIEGWITPEPNTATIIGGKRKGLIGYYERPPENWWEKYLKLALIGGGVILGAALVVPPAIRAIAERERSSRRLGYPTKEQK